MKNLKFIVFSLLICFGLSVQAQGDGEAASDTNTVSADDLMSSGESGSEESGRLAAEDQFKRTIQQVFQQSTPDQEIQNLATSVNGATSSAGLQSFVTALGLQVPKCQQYVQQASRCCKDATSCGGSRFAEIAKSAAGIAPMLAALAGGDNAGGMASCLSALPQLIDGMGVSKGESAVCRMYRDGNGVSGCRDYCKGISSAITMVKNRIPAIASNEQVPVSNFSALDSQLGSYAEQMTEYSKTCVSNTEEGEEEANSATNQMQQTASSAIACADAFADEGDSLEPEEEYDPNKIDASNVTGLGVNDGSVLGKTSADTFGAAVEPDLAADDDLEDEPRTNNQATNANAGATPQGIRGGGGGGVGRSGGGGRNPSGKTGKKRGSKKKDSGLISGYGKPSSTGGGSGSGVKGKGKFNFAKAKKEKEAEKAKKKSLSRLLASVGVSPSSQDNIFERVSKKFEVSSVKEKLFDAKLNKKSWVK